MRNLKKWILVLGILIVIIIIILIIAILYQNNAEIIHGVDEEGSDISFDVDTTLKPVTVRNNYYIVKNSINKFYTYYFNIYDLESDNYIIDEEVEASIENTQQQYANAIYDMLDTEYKNSMEITQDNILDKLPEINEVVVNINNMYVSQRTVNMSIYIAQGTIRERQSGNISNFIIMVKVDALNQTFSLFLQDYLEAEYDQIKVGEEINIETAETIEKNNNNQYDYQNITDETYSEDLINKYKEEILYNQQLAYEHLDDEYKNKKFGSFENFQSYAQERVRENVLLELDRYQKTTENGYTQYVCIDQNGNYYIFRETTVMDYKLILDTYTIDLPEFIEQYNNADENTKVQLNLQKIFEALNRKDYEYIYSKLDETYKANNFDTQEKFEEYISNTFFENNAFGYSSYQKNGDVYIYEVTITNASDTTQTIEKQFVVKLLEGTDFVMSFSI